MREILIDLAYIISTILFIFGLKMMGRPATARKGNIISALGMALGIIATLCYKDILSFQMIVIGTLIGSIIGYIFAKTVAMTSMPEMVALLNGFGGMGSLLVSWAEYEHTPNSDGFGLSSMFLTVLIGGVTFSGSMIAWAKLKEVMDGKPTLFRGQKPLNALLLLGSIAIGVVFTVMGGEGQTPFLLLCIITAISLILGVLAVIPIGGADMPVVISLLNSYSGLAACTAGFVVQNNLLIVAGALVGASGIILTQIMCKAMNRSLANVLFSGFGGETKQSSAKVEGEVKPLSSEDAFYVLESARSVVFVPGYGLAVAQAQHVVKELGQLLENNGAEIKYAIHPVAGRMPGHMNVLLAEANVPYDQLVEMDDINRIIDTVDVCIVIGANDVVNPAAREDKGSPIYGMPIINVDSAKTTIVLKRSMRSGFAGIENPLFYKPNTRMLFGDAKESITALVSEFKGAN